MKKIILIGITFSLVLISCNSGFSGTLGGGNIYEYNCSKEQLNFFLDSISKYNTSLKVPEKLKKYDDWDKAGYGFLREKIFYIKEKNANDDAMYFVSVIPGSEVQKNPGVSIRSVFKVKEYLLGWKNFKDLDSSDKKRDRK